MPRAGLCRDAVVDTALSILDAHGPDGLTLKAVADHVGVAAPSLYKHVRGLPELRRLLVIRVLHEMADCMATAVMGRAENDALHAYLTQYRLMAGRYPHRHALIERSSYDDPIFAAAAQRVIDVAYAVVRGFGLEGEDLVHAVRTVRAAVTGFVSLEHGLGYRAPIDPDTSFAYLSRALAAGLDRAAPPGPYAAHRGWSTDRQTAAQTSFADTP